MGPRLRPQSLNCIRLLPSVYQQRFDLNRRYVMSLEDQNLLQNHYLEAGLRTPRGLVENTWGVGEPTLFQGTVTGNAVPTEGHWGWESPVFELRGHFTGHWLSAAAHIYAATGDAQVKAKLDHAISELGRIQTENGGEWVGSIPEKYLFWLARDKEVLVPHYTLHKTLMGLYDAYAVAGNVQALGIMENFARWFTRWTGQFTRTEMDNILDSETGGMLEAWANLYGATGKPEHLDLVDRYTRARLFDRILAGEDPLTNHHANTTIPEAQGAARAYEVTGNQRWRDIVEAYWRCAVTDRGYFCTGGQTSGELWTPPFEFSARLGPKTQEHCTVYNMIRLADYLLRWTGEAKYADYIERNRLNGILAQQNPRTGMIAYYLPLHAGGRKIRGTPTRDFWCCHGSLVQANAVHGAYVYYDDVDGLVISQYVPSELTWQREGVTVSIKQVLDSEAYSIQSVARDSATHRPNRWSVELSVSCARPVDFALKIRIPWWVAGQATIQVNGQDCDLAASPGSFHTLRKQWGNDTVRLEFPKQLSTCPLPDDPDMVALMDGPVVLAGLCDEERVLSGDPGRPETLLRPDDERLWMNWNSGYRTNKQDRGFRLLPLHEICDEAYTVYFPVRSEH